MGFIGMTTVGSTNTPISFMAYAKHFFPTTSGEKFDKIVPMTGTGSESFTASGKCLDAGEYDCHFVFQGNQYAQPTEHNAFCSPKAYVKGKQIDMSRTTKITMAKNDIFEVKLSVHYTGPGSDTNGFIVAVLSPHID